VRIQVFWDVIQADELVHFGAHSQLLNLDSFLSVVKNVYMSAAFEYAIAECAGDERHPHIVILTFMQSAQNISCMGWDCTL
jgi:hypothetical protein